MKAGIVFADRLTTVSRRYAEEIQTSEFGYGLQGDRSCLQTLRHHQWHRYRYLESGHRSASAENIFGRQADRQAGLQTSPARRDGL